MTGFVSIDRNEVTATVTLANPERMNALDTTMWRELEKAFVALSADDRLRCVILRGAGDRAFAAGADVAEFATVRSNRAQAAGYAGVTHPALQAIAHCIHPVVAQIHGACVGGGLEIASMCDMRICGESSRFGIPIKRLGLVVSYHELAGLIALVGSATALEILLEGRVFGAAEALAKGLVTRVVPDAEVADEVSAAVSHIVEGAPLVARWHKRFVRRLADQRPITDAEMNECYACFDTDDFRIGYEAFLEKRKATFTGR
ncbi:MAG: enoyl-CoA hydratase/isomerase family protein [Burkholderiales bacterium]|nr:enoyl-CoA hydratase/isomerase family protein [Burkholderiales bacterium]